VRAGALAVVCVWGCIGACAADPGASTGGGLSATTRHDRLALIRDTAAQMDLYNAALLDGIAMSKTNLTHCWSETTYACKEPDSPSCGGPIIAGSADGPCAAMQGGLGMFQFDAGTWADTVALYGDAILTVSGNTAQAVSFVVDQVTLDVPGVTGWLAAVDWMNHVPLVAGFEFTGAGGEHVELDSTTGQPGQKLVFDAIRVTPGDAPCQTRAACCAGAGAGACADE
jgi:hypothetical protein